MGSGPGVESGEVPLTLPNSKCATHGKARGVRGWVRGGRDTRTPGAVAIEVASVRGGGVAGADMTALRDVEDRRKGKFREVDRAVKRVYSRGDETQNLSGGLRCAPNRTSPSLS